MLKRSFFLLILSIALASCGGVTTKSIEQVPVAKDKLRFIDFYSNECPNCLIMQPIVDKLAERYRDHLSLEALDVDAEGKELFKSLGLNSNPVFLIVKADGTILYKGFGRVPELALDKAIQNAIGL